MSDSINAVPLDYHSVDILDFLFRAQIKDIGIISESNTISHTANIHQYYGGKTCKKRAEPHK